MPSRILLPGHLIHGITGWHGLEVISKGHPVQPRLHWAGSGYPQPCPASPWTPLGMRSQLPPWATCYSVPAPSWYRTVPHIQSKSALLWFEAIALVLLSLQAFSNSLSAAFVSTTKQWTASGLDHPANRVPKALVTDKTQYLHYLSCSPALPVINPSGPTSWMKKSHFCI